MACVDRRCGHWPAGESGLLARLRDSSQRNTIGEYPRRPAPLVGACNRDDTACFTCGAFRSAAEQLDNMSLLEFAERDSEDQTRDSEDQTIEAICYAEVHDDFGFHYQWTW